jgi:Chemotaxis signal transduction protein
MGEYLTFAIAGEICAAPIRDVETVLEMVDLRRVSGAPAYVAGLLDLRGEAVPVIDVRRKLGLEEGDSSLGCIIVMSIGQEGSRRQVGALVDSVYEVVQIAEPSISSVEDFAVPFDRGVVMGIAKGESGFVTMIAVDRLFETQVPA